MGGKDFPRREKKKPKKKARKAVWPSLPGQTEQVEVVRSRGKKGEA